MASDTERPDPETAEPAAGERSEDGSGLDRRIIAATGYLPMMFFVPLVAGRGSDFAEFHGRQSLVLFLAFAALWVGIWFASLVLGRIMGDIVLLGFLFRALGWLLRNVAGGLLALGYLAAVVYGIAQAVTGSRKNMPYLGVYAERYRCP